MPEHVKVESIDGKPHMRFPREEALERLLRDMLRWMPCRQPCYRCERYHYPDGCEFEQRMCELGVEVDG